MARNTDSSTQEGLRDVLERAGWYPGREERAQAESWAHRLERPGGFELFQAAREALSEFGGLEVAVSGPGIDFAKGSFRIDPTLALGEEERFAQHASALGSRLYPLGEAYDGNAFLAIDEQGRVYLLMDEIHWGANSMTEAMESLILGQRPPGKSHLNR